MERSRTAFHEILDATPLPNGPTSLPKTVAVFLILLTTLLVGVAAAVVLQLMNGSAPGGAQASIFFGTSSRARST